MKQPSRILAIVNTLDVAQPALTRASLLARASGAHLRVQAIVYDPDSATTLFHWNEEERADQRKLRLQKTKARLEKLVRNLGVNGDCFTHWGHPFDQAALEVIDEYQPDLVVIQRRQPGVERLSNAEWRLLSRSPAPVWLAHDKPWLDEPRTVASVDPSHSNDKPAVLDQLIISAGMAIRSLLGGDLTLLHALGETPASIDIAQDPDEYEQQLRKARAERIQGMLTDGVEVEVDLIAREPERALREAVEKHNASLVIMGLLARSRIADMLIGSTAREFLPTYAGDVLLIKH